MRSIFGEGVGLDVEIYPLSEVRSALLRSAAVVA
jgi:hypothetical protein